MHTLIHKMHTQFKFYVFTCRNNLGGQVSFPMYLFSAKLQLVSIHKTHTPEIYFCFGMSHWRYTH